MPTLEWIGKDKVVNYRNFIVFKNREFGINGTYMMSRFIEIMREL